MKQNINMIEILKIKSPKNKYVFFLVKFRLSSIK